MKSITSNMDSTSFTQRKGGRRSDLGPRAGLLYIKVRMQEKHKIKEERTGDVKSLHTRLICTSSNLM